MQENSLEWLHQKIKKMQENSMDWFHSIINMQENWLLVASICKTQTVSNGCINGQCARK